MSYRNSNSRNYQNPDEPIDVTKLDNRKIVHVIDNETGFCSICNKFENPALIKKNYVKCGEIKVKTRDISDEHTQSNEVNRGDGGGGNGTGGDGSPDHDAISQHSTFEQTIFMQNKKNNKVLTSEICDLFKGRMCFKSCSLCDSICYVPLWFLLVFFFIVLLFIAGLIVSAVFYADQKRTDLKSYTESCTNNSNCDHRKGLYCRTRNAFGTEYCNCPTFSASGMCDCSSSSYYWNGITCASVYGYGEGPCSGNYSCTAGLICDRTTLKCICPPSTPSWNSLSKTCDYLYLGCYIYCLNLTNCDVTGGSFVLTGFILPIDLDVCLLQCSVFNTKYAIFLYASQYKCACTNTYNTYAKRASDSECSIPCNYYSPTGIGRCPLINGRYSAFQLGA